MLRLNRRRSVIGDNHMATGPDQCCQAPPDGLRAIAEKPEFELNVDDVGFGCPIDDVAKGGIGRFLSKLRVGSKKIHRQGCDIDLEVDLLPQRNLEVLDILGDTAGPAVAGDNQKLGQSLRMCDRRHVQIDLVHAKTTPRS